MPPCVNGRKRKPNGQFIRNKCKNKRRRISSAEHETKAENIAETSDEQTPLPEHAKCCWRDGRRIVKLGYLADQLKAGCSECKNPLNIINTMDETTHGLGLNPLHSVRGMPTAQCHKDRENSPQTYEEECRKTDMGHKYKGSNRFVKFIIIAFLFIPIHFFTTYSRP